MSEAYSALRLSQLQAIDLSTQIGRKALLGLLEKADRELSARLAQDPYLRSDKGKASFTATQMRATLVHIRKVTAQVTHGIERILKNQVGAASNHAVGNILEYLEKADKVFKGVASAPLNLREVSMMNKVAAGVEASLLRRLSSGEPGTGTSVTARRKKMGILQRYGVETIDKFEESLQQGFVQKKSWGDVRDKLTEDSPFLQGAPAHWAERIVRTETMGAYNKAGLETIKAADETLGDMCKILSATFDDRTGWDSYQVHGQIRLPNEPFEWDGEFYQNPPNRPNDREVVVPHRISWPIPPYLKQKTDAEVMKRFKMQRKTGSPGPRPKMTTIPIERFGKPAK